MSDAVRVLKNSGFLYARMFITIFISLYSTRLILEALGTSDFGIFAVVGGAVAMLTFLNSTMANATQRFLSFSMGENNLIKQKQIFNISVLLHLGVGIVVLMLLEIAYLFLFDYVLNIDSTRIQAAKYVYQFVAFSTFVTILAVPYNAILNAHENMFFIAITGVFESVFRLIIALILINTSGDRLIIYAALTGISTILLVLIRAIYSHLYHEEVIIKIKTYFDKNLFKEMTKFAGWSFFTSIASMFTNYGRNILVNVYFGTSVNSAQSVTNQIAGQLSSFSIVLLKALNPVIVKSEGSGNRKKMIESVFMGSKLSYFLLFFVSTPVIVEMNYILNIWLIEVPKFTIEFCRLTLLAYTIGQLTLPLTTLIGATGNIKNFQITISFSAFIPFIIAWMLYNFGYSPVSLYYVYFGYEAIRFSIVLYFSKATSGLSIPNFLKNVLVKVLLVSMLVYVLIMPVHLFLDESLFRLLIILFIHTIAFLFLVYKIGLSKKEEELVESLLIKSKIKLFKNSNKLK